MTTRYFRDRTDKNGFKRGTGAYSAPTIKLNRSSYLEEHARGIHKDISAKVFANGNRVRPDTDSQIGGGSGRVSSGTRPAHRAKNVGKNSGGWGK
jgi:hypothetical protein